MAVHSHSQVPEADAISRKFNLCDERASVYQDAMICSIVWAVRDFRPAPHIFTGAKTRRPELNPVLEYAKRDIQSNHKWLHPELDL